MLETQTTVKKAERRQGGRMKGWGAGQRGQMQGEECRATGWEIGVEVGVQAENLEGRAWVNNKG